MKYAIRFSQLLMKWMVSLEAGSSIRVVTRRTPSSLSKGLKGFFCILKIIIFNHRGGFHHVSNKSNYFADIYRGGMHLIVAIVAMISVSIVKFDAVPHLPILFSILLLICYGLLKKFLP